LNDNLKRYNALSQAPSEALKTIQAGRLKGKSDINPQWRIKAMTEQYGECGIGWRWELRRLWTEPAPNAQVMAFAEVAVSTRHADGWSEAIPGVGGSMLVVQESSGLHTNDEGYKMAITDALSVALKFLGVAADIYMGFWDGSKYRGRVPPRPPPPPQSPEPPP